MEPNSPKKIQFATPLFHSRLDPQAAEHIRRRRPTPATLGLHNNPTAAGAVGQQSSGCPGEAASADQSAAQRKQSVYTPPSMKELQQVVEQNLQTHENLEVGPCDDLDPLSPITAQHNGIAAQWANHNYPEPNGNEAYLNLLPGTEDYPQSFTGGATPLRTQRESFPEEEEEEEDADTQKKNTNP